MSFGRSFVEGMAMFGFVVIVGIALLGPVLAAAYIGTLLFGEEPNLPTLALGIVGLGVGGGLAGALIDTFYRRMTNV